MDYLDRWNEAASPKPATARQRVVALRSFYGFCEERDYIDRSPAATLKLPKVPRKAVDYLPSEEVERMLAVAQIARMRSSLSVPPATGASTTAWTVRTTTRHSL